MAERGFRVLALDLPGFGKSDKPRTFSYTMVDQAYVVLEFLKRVDAEDPVLVGHSMGGHISLALAIERPDVARALVLVSPAGFEKFTRREELWFKSVFSSALVKNAEPRDIFGSVRYNNFSRWDDDYRWLIRERIGVIQGPQFDDYAYANVKSVHGLLDTDFTRDNLGRIKVPVLILYGEHDRLIPNRFLHPGPTTDVMAYGANELPDATLRGFHRCGHTLQIDCHSDVNSEIISFLNAL
ncbi:MAG: alpha/beta fold hydrolase [Myxococcota bacterium]